jgi:hypothetical protein
MSNKIQILSKEKVKMSKLLWGGKNNTTISRMIGGAGDLGGNLPGQTETTTTTTTTIPTGTTEVPVPATGVDLKIFKITGNQNPNLELVFSDVVDSSVGLYIVSAAEVVELGNGNFRASVDGIMSNDFSINIQIQPQQLPDATINAAHYKLEPTREIVETLVTQIVANDNGKVDVPVLFGVDYSVFNIAPPGNPIGGQQTITGGFTIPTPTPTPVATENPILTPDPFSFPSELLDVAALPNWAESAPRTISGINQQVNANVRQGSTGVNTQFKVNDGEWGAQSLSVNDGDVVQVRLQTKNIAHFAVAQFHSQLINELGINVTLDVGNGTFIYNVSAMTTTQSNNPQDNKYSGGNNP